MSGDNGKPNGESLPPEMLEAQAQAQQHVVEMMTAMLSGLSTRAPAVDVLLHLAEQAFVQQHALGVVLEDAVEPTKREANPYWGVKITQRASGAYAVVRVPKDFGRCKTLDEVGQYIMVLTLALDSLPRALLAAHGFELGFFQAPEPSLIVRPG